MVEGKLDITEISEEEAKNIIQKASLVARVLGKNYSENGITHNIYCRIYTGSGLADTDYFRYLRSVRKYLPNVKRKINGRLKEVELCIDHLLSPFSKIVETMIIRHRNVTTFYAELENKNYDGEEKEIKPVRMYQYKMDIRWKEELDRLYEHLKRKADIEVAS